MIYEPEAPAKKRAQQCNAIHTRLRRRKGENLKHVKT
jgi:hypothetical protein